jgi:outer membrane protein
MRIRYNFIFLLIIFSFPPPSYAEETLLDIYHQAEENDSQLRIQTAEQYIASEKKQQVKSTFSPQITAGAGAQENFSSSRWMTGDTVENTTIGYNLSLDYILYDRQRNLMLKQTDSVISQTQVQYDAARQTLMFDTAQRYFAVLRAKDNLGSARTTREAFQKQLEQTKQRFEVGLIAITDVQESQAGYDLSVADEIQAQNELHNAQESLRELTGTYHQFLASLREDSPLLSPEPDDIEQWTKIALENNAQIAAARYNVDIAKQEIDVQRAADYPTVDLVAKHGYNDVLRGEGRSPGTDNSVGVQVSYYLYRGGIVDSKVRESHQRYNQALDRLEQLRDSVQLQTHEAFLSVSSNISRVKALKQAVLSTQTALEAVQTGVEVGTRTSIDLLNARRDLLKAQRDYASARYEYVLSSLRLKQAAGLIQLDDFASINAWLVTNTPASNATKIPVAAPIVEKKAKKSRAAKTPKDAK